MNKFYVDMQSSSSDEKSQSMQHEKYEKEDVAAVASNLYRISFSHSFHHFIGPDHIYENRVHRKQE